MEIIMIAGSILVAGLLAMEVVSLTMGSRRARQKKIWKDSQINTGHRSQASYVSDKFDWKNALIRAGLWAVIGFCFIYGWSI